MEGKKPRIITSLASLGSADVGSTIIGGIFWFVIATLIETEQYGEINYLLSIVGISFTICLIGVRETIVVYTAKKNPIVPTIFIITGIMGLVGFFTLSIMFSKLDISFLLLGYIVNDLCLGYFLGLKFYKKYAKFVLTQKGLSFVLGILFVLVFGYEGIIFALAISYAHFIIIYVKVGRLEKIKFSSLKESKFLIDNYIMNISTNFRGQLDKIILLPLAGYSLIGNNALGLQVFAIIMVFPRLVFKYILPHDVDGNENKNLKIFTVIFGVAAAFLGYFLTPIILPVIFPKFTGVVEIIQIISFAAIPASINQIQTSKLLAMEKARSVLVSRLTGLIAIIVLLIILTPTLQEKGVAIAYLVSSSILCLSLFIFNLRANSQ